MTKCGHVWKHLRIRNAGFSGSVRDYVTQVCVKPRAHEGPHRSSTGVLLRKRTLHD